MTLLSVLVACSDPSTSGPEPVGPDPDPPTNVEPPTTDTTEPPTDTTPPTTDTTADCAATNTIVEVSAAAGPITTLLEVAVTLSEPSPVAVQCVADAEPDQIFFAETTESATEHVVRLSGLLPRNTYSCTAAAVCPTTAAPTAFAYETGEAPAEISRLDVDIDPVLGMEGAWTLAPYTTNIFGGATYVVMWGPDGRPRWWSRLPEGVGMWVEARYDVGEGTVVWGGGMDDEGRVRILDLWEGEQYAFAPAGWQQEEFHHDGKRIADGRLLTLEIRENSDGGNDWDGFGLRLVDPVTGAVDAEFDSQVLVDDGTLPPASGFSNDPWHANWADWAETPDGPVFMVSLCFAMEILQIDATTGEVRWVFGDDQGWTLLDAAGEPLSEAVLPECQHGLEFDGTKLLIYDNGQIRNQSFAQEWEIDAPNHTATLLWSWTEPGWNEDYLGDIDWLPNDRVLITEATMFGEAHIVEVDKLTGDVASRLVMTEGFTYRADRYAGCDLFSSAKECPELQDRVTALAPLLTP